MLKPFFRNLLTIACVVSLLALSFISFSLKAYARPAHINKSARTTSQANLPNPPWWSGNCDSNNDPGSYPLGASFRGLEACGPLNRMHLVHFFPKAWGEYEWQCTELVMRYMYLAFNVTPYDANGNQVVQNFHFAKYPGLMQSVKNNGKSPLPQPGDILSYDDNDPNNTAGHTSIVTNVSQTRITVIEENGSSNGTSTLQVKNGIIQPFSYGKGGQYKMWITSWLHVLSSPPKKVNAALFGVATVSANDVWAVGEYEDSSGNYRTLTEQWNGSKWSVITSPSVKSVDNWLSGVAVVSASDIWAVGHSEDSSGDTQTLIEEWNGTAWSIIPSPNPGPYEDSLEGVTAISANDVWASGFYEDSTGYYQTLIEHWNGMSWSTVAGSNPGQLDELDGIAAISTNDVWAVGDYADSNGNFYTLIEQWNGSAWSTIPSPTPSGSILVDLNGISAVSDSEIWAAGYYQASGNNAYVPLTEQWNGTAWSIVPSPTPSGSISAVLNGVAAISANNAWAADYYTAYNGYDYSLIEQWNGSAWNIVPSPNPNESISVWLNGVSAVSANDIWSVGYYGTSSGYSQTLIEQWNGSTWNIIPSP